jgi:hypothetical protein
MIVGIGLIRFVFEIYLCGSKQLYKKLKFEETKRGNVNVQTNQRGDTKLTYRKVEATSLMMPSQ